MRSRINVPHGLTVTPASIEVLDDPARRMGVVVHGWQPGNGSRYDLSFVRRAGGGWIGVWDGAWIVFKCYPNGPRTSIEVVAMQPDSALSDPDRAAIRALCIALDAEGLLS